MTRPRSELEIRTVDVCDDVALRAVYDVSSRAELHDREDSPHWSWAEFAGTVRRPRPGERIQIVAGYVDGRMVGTGTWVYGEHDNLDNCWVATTVDPPVRGLGHGRALLDHVCGAATGVGRTTLMAVTRIPFDRLRTHPHRRFAEAAGFTLSHAEIVRHLQLPVDVRIIERWAAEAARAAAGYRIATYVDGIPDELAPSYCAIHGLLSVDAPTGDVEWEEETITPAQLAESRAGSVAQGRTILDTVAVTPEGTVAAYTTLMVPPEPRTDASQWGTFVHREHRGHRLGLATKTANLQALQAAHPTMRRVVTQNAETNEPMIAVNERMGFEPVEASVEFVRRSNPVDAGRPAP